MLLFPVLALYLAVAGAATVITESSSSTLFQGTGTNDNDIVIQTNDVQRHSIFFLLSTAGAMDVFVSLDGTNYATAALSLIDDGAITQDPVLATVANRVYAFRGIFRKIRVLQNGGAAVANGTLLAGSL
jgi:hypothetical protein